jgi:hypothetical protein
MKASEFVQTYGKKPIQTWESAAFALAQAGQTMPWPMVPIKLEVPGHSATLEVASDFFSIGEPDDWMRMPLTPGTAQAIANLNGYLLPTPKIVAEIAKQANVQLTPQPQWPNKGINLDEFARHNATIETQRAGRAGLISGHKKDVIISNIYKPKKVLIYGWFWPPGVKPPAGMGNPIQPRSNIHYDGFADYSHGIRFISPVMTVDGQQMKTEDVLRSQELSKLVSDEGIVRVIRYPAPNDPQPYRPADLATYAALNDVYPKPNLPSLTDVGLSVISEQAASRLAAKKPST